MHRSDPELIQACQRGEQVAWNELVERYGRLIYSIPRRYGLSEADSDDVFSAVWTVAFRKLNELRDDTRLSAWLITTTHRETWRVGKKRGTYRELDQAIPDLDSPAPEQAETWERQHLVHQGLTELGGRCEELLRALFLESGAPDYEAIATRLGMPVGSIGPTRARCFEKLEKILARLGLDGQ